MEKLNMDFTKPLKGSQITCLPELPSKDLKPEIGTVIAVPSEKQGQLNLYTWDDDWTLITTIDISYSGLKELKEDCDDLENVLNTLNTLNTVSSNTEDDTFLQNCRKVYSKILEAKRELVDDLIGQFERGLKD